MCSPAPGGWDSGRMTDWLGLFNDGVDELLPLPLRERVGGRGGMVLAAAQLPMGKSTACCA